MQNTSIVKIALVEAEEIVQQNTAPKASEFNYREVLSNKEWQE
jgi:hypothetical protein